MNQFSIGVTSIIRAGRCSRLGVRWAPLDHLGRASDHQQGGKNRGYSFKVLSIVPGSYKSLTKN